ncbi:MAG TPA: transglycosylase SLT domain-containing protein [Blastocatellia bacterium]|nr:transglycosylase SLT domain-containing protein [Blastocatellia bacterium]
MFRSSFTRRHAKKSLTQKNLALLPIALMLVTLVTPLTASCQRNRGDAERSVSELRSLVAGSGGKPTAADLVRIENKHDKTRAASLARFLRGYLAYSAQNYSAALEAFDPSTITANSSLGDYALFYRAESEAAINARGDALRDYTSVATKHGDSLMVRAARLRAAEMSLASGDPSHAIKDLGRMVESKDADAIYITAQAYEASGKTEQALKLYRTIYYELPATAASPQAETRLAALGASPKEKPGSAEEERSRVDALFDSQQYWDAARAYQDLVTGFPDLERRDEIQLRLGVSLLNSKQPAQAVLPLSRVSSRSPELQAEAMFRQAEALRRSNRTAESSSVVDRLLSQYPRSRWATEALHDLATNLDKQDHTSEAAVRYKQLLSAYPKSGYAPEASYQIGWQAYESKSYADAARLLEQHLASYRYPETKFTGEACLWAGKAEERLGNRARALALYSLVSERYRYGYHGYIAGIRARQLQSADPKLKAELPKPDSDLERIRRNVLHVEKIQETADGSETGRVSRANDLEVIGLTDLAIKELNKALESSPESPKLNLLLAQIYSGRGETFQATLVLRKGYPDLYSYQDSDLPREAWEIFFPLSDWETIKREAKQYGIDPYVAAGLIRQESVFNPNAVSRVGARGLMQVMPATGLLIAKRQGTGSITAADLFNPSLNIKLGMNYLAQMIGQLGRIEYAAAGYNAGPGRAKRWVAERGSLDIEDWIESIPFTETRGYVQGVLRYAANYRRLYKE